MGCRVQQSWLGLAEDGGEFVRKWIVLDNGVLWVYRKPPGPGEGFADQVVPLNDAEICCPAPSCDDSPEQELTLAVRLGTGVVSLRASSPEEYSRWVSAMLESARQWRMRRQVVGQHRAGNEDQITGKTSRDSVNPSIKPPQDDLGGGRQRVAVSLVRLSAQVTALRQATRRAVTHCLCDDVLPRFHRRALADAVDKVWKVCERVRGVVEQGLHAAPEGNGCPSVYDAVLVIRDEVAVFLSYCSLLQDLKLMLKNDCVVKTNASLSTSPLRSLSAVRDSLRRLGPLIQDRGEEVVQRAALAAVDSTLHRCWAEIRDQHSSLFLGEHAPERNQPSPPRERVRSLPDDVLYYMREKNKDFAVCLPFKPTHSVRRLASRLRADVARQSLRRARKRARSDAQSLLLDCDGSLENVPMSTLRHSARSEVAEESAGDMGLPSQDDPDANMGPKYSRVTKVSAEVPVGGLEQVPLVEVESVAELDSPPKAPPRRRSLPMTPDDPRSKKMVDDLKKRSEGEISMLSPDSVVFRYGKILGFATEVVEGKDDLVDGPEPDHPKAAPRKGPRRELWIPKEMAVDASDARLSLDAEVFSESDEENIYEEIPEDCEEWAPAFSDLRDLGDSLNHPVTPATPNGGGRRALWCETVEVQRSGLLQHLTSAENALQEAKFEVLSSEESYLRSLEMLASRVQAVLDMQDPRVLADHERDVVCSYLDSARACSLRFVGALRVLWTRDVQLDELCALIYRQAAGPLLQYPGVVSQQPRAANTLIRLQRLDCAQAGQLVPLLSLPAQRVSRLPLLLAAILRRLDQRASEATFCRAALDRLNHIVRECNEALRRAEHGERLAEEGRRLPCDSSPRERRSWRERKNAVLVRAKSIFKSGSSTRPRARTSTDSLFPLAYV